MFPVIIRMVKNLKNPREFGVGFKKTQLFPALVKIWAKDIRAHFWVEFYLFF